MSISEMGWKHWVIDASLGEGLPGFCFCPLDGEGDPMNDAIVTGMNVFSDVPPDGGKLVAIFHPDGQEAVENWCIANRTALEELDKKLGRNNGMRA